MKKKKKKFLHGAVRIKNVAKRKKYPSEKGKNILPTRFLEKKKFANQKSTPPPPPHPRHPCAADKRQFAGSYHKGRVTADYFYERFKDGAKSAKLMQGKDLKWFVSGVFFN